MNAAGKNDAREEANKMGKLGLVVEGGGMKCAYSAGILDKFLDEHVTFDYVIGVSAGSANALSYLAGQRGRNLRFYTTHIHEPGYFGPASFLKSGDLFGLDYIYSTVTNSSGSDPIDYPAIAANPAIYELVTTNAVTGTPIYLGKDRLSQDNYEAVKASCALPAACRPRMIDGVPCYDGGISDPIPVDRALAQGCDKVVVILSKPRGFQKQPEKFRAFYTKACRKYPRIIDLLDNRHIDYMIHYRHVFDLEREGSVFVFAPSQSLAMSTFAMDATENRRLYDLGLMDYADRAIALRSFLQEA